MEFIGSVGIETPHWKLQADEGLQSIIADRVNQSTRLQVVLLRSYDWDFGLFATGQLGLQLRSNRVPNARIELSSNLVWGCGFYPSIAFVSTQLYQQKTVLIILGRRITRVSSSYSRKLDYRIGAT